jgi:hypothetical protein
MLPTFFQKYNSAIPAKKPYAEGSVAKDVALEIVSEK